MKLRIKGNSLRLRISRSELDRFAAGERLAETIHFAPDADARLTYSLVQDASASALQVDYQPLAVALRVPTKLSQTWAHSEQVGLYRTADLGDQGQLEISLEKDFACLDLSDAENADTFPNPNAGRAC